LELKKQNIKGLIIDLRDNPGGLLDQAVQIVNFFIPKNKVVVVSKGKSLNSNMTYTTTENPIDANIPIVVLINEFSASASEIVAGALQDYDRAIIVGNYSYGKGLVQRIFDLGYNSKIKITISKYYIPSGRCIQKIDYYNSETNLYKKYFTANGRIVYEGNGISPDYIVTNHDSIPNVVSVFLKSKHSFLFYNSVFKNIDTSKIKSPTDIKYNNIEFLVDFLDKTDFYNTMEEIKELENINKSFENDQIINNEVNELKTKILENYKNSIIKNAEIIEFVIGKEIAKRKFYRTGVIKYSLANEKEIIFAKNLLNNSQKYQKTLKP
jgi:carboxyl-terminal processing protease